MSANYSLFFDQKRFRSEGCPNCPFLELRGNTDALDSCTSTVFEGLITIANPKKSWVAKWQRLDSYVPGVYATKVSGSIPEDIRNGLIEDGHTAGSSLAFGQKPKKTKKQQRKKASSQPQQAQRNSTQNAYREAVLDSVLGGIDDDDAHERASASAPRNAQQQSR
ncbi:Spt4/RpoE2 zinc finger-domain-containing protein [Nemania serpens]|nr:Spt4/RpoE2 zinc finger-domain-containing protein [Nemania serpens]